MAKKYYWAILLVVITIIVMYVSGMSNTYLSEPLDIGFNQYLDLKTGVLFVTLLVIGFTIGFFVFNKNKRNKE